LHYYKVWPEERLHLWTYLDFKERVNAIPMGYKCSGYVIHYRYYATEKPIDMAIFDEYKLNYTEVTLEAISKDENKRR